MAKGVLVDITKCVGCGSCTVACKLWNDMKFSEKEPTMGPEAKLSANNWTVVRFNEVKKENGKVWRFVKTQCLHCQDAACASACFAKALQKTKDGPVIYYPHLCVGCRYCMIACPFNVPKYEWDKTFPLVSKCQMCSTKVAKGEAPACVSVCPAGVFKYGERDEILKEAKATIARDSKYVQEVYGEKQAGGTSWLYISDVPFEQLGFNTKISSVPVSTYSHNFLKYTPVVAVSWGIILTGLYHYTKRRNEISKDSGKNVKL
ncbi:4Fe-4S dicluster domain-containing protein [Desulforamulus putei]|uniref:Formate dehydrogenase iron-sulfur subunit n=1 Tax=Desulforamulus putei DSM 12395 TaxID=1121429 RepID=A0A1M4SBR2_9FIRM|nr:4Fe-4S dicluster domain-containing protein [Desulforamulus putei]SHE29608.1 formate dehydrogenase iron-sulfur subunit [Desulforamulus putei DSM 12395]